jgi:serine protease DegQ
MRRLWLLFAQTVTIALALYLVYYAVKPDFGRSRAPTVQQLGTPAQPAATIEAAPVSSANSFRAAAGRAMPAVVNILTSKAVQRKHPLMRDPYFKRFFGEPEEEDDDDQNSLGSGVIVSRTATS